MSKVTALHGSGTPTLASPVDQFQEALQIVARLISQGRLHEQILRSAGVRLDRAGAALLHKLAAEGDSLRITGLAEMLGVDPYSIPEDYRPRYNIAPTDPHFIVTSKYEQRNAIDARWGLVNS